MQSYSRLLLPTVHPVLYAALQCGCPGLEETRGALSLNYRLGSKHLSVQIHLWLLSVRGSSRALAGERQQECEHGEKRDEIMGTVHHVYSFG